MENQITQDAESEVLPHAGAISSTFTGQSVADRQEARLNRVLDYQAASLEKENALEANLGSINSGLMRIGLWLDETIERAIESGPRTIERIQELMPAIDAHLRVTRQVDRFAQVELRAAESRKPSGAYDTETTVLAVASRAEEIDQSEDSAI